MSIFNHAFSKTTKKSYFNTRNSAWQFLIDNNVTTYPLDLKRILAQNGWKVKNMQEYVLKHPELRKFVKGKPCATIKKDGSYIILINTSKSSYERNRFSIAHEIGHIYLEHLNLTKKQMEKEANMFASRILMPLFLFKELNLTTVEEVADLFEVSQEASKYRLERFKKVAERNKFYTNPLERQVFKQLKEFIQRRKNN